MRFFLLSILFLSLIACTEAKVGMDDLNLKYSKFSVFQDGQETNFVRVNAQSLVASYQLSCNANAAQLYLRWGDSGDWTLVTSLTPENDKCSLTHALTPPPTKSWPVIEAQLKIADTKGRETEVRSVEFITPSFASDGPKIAINEDKPYTNSFDVTVSMNASMEAGTHKNLTASEVYLTSTPGCSSGGTWKTYTATTALPMTLPIENETNFIYAKFKDSVGNESSCISDSIIHDSIAPSAMNFSINNGALQTTEAPVTLTLDAAGDVDEMLINNSNDCTGPGVWEKYSTSKPWSLAGQGTNTLSVLFRDRADNRSECLTASITYDSVPPSSPETLALDTGVQATDNLNPVKVRVSPVIPGDTAWLYLTSDCSGSPVGSAVAERGGYAIVPASLTGPDGSRTFYAKVTDTDNLSSSCSTANVSYVLDSTPPQVTSVTSNLASGYYTSGQMIDVSVSFDDPVVVSGTDLALRLNFNGSLREASYIGGSGTTQINFTYIAIPGDFTGALEYESTLAIALKTSTIQDTVGNTANLVLPAPGAAGSLSAGKSIAVNFVVGLERAPGYAEVSSRDPVQIKVTGVMTGYKAKVYTSASCAENSFAGEAISSGGGSATASIDLSGINGERTFYARIFGTDGNATTACSTSFVKYTLNTSSPVITGVKAISPNGNYNTGSAILIGVDFSSEMYVVGTGLTLALNLNGTTITIPYDSGHGTSTLVFKYQVLESHLSDDLDIYSSTALSLNGATIKNSLDILADLTLPQPGSAASLKTNSNISINHIQTLDVGKGPGVERRDRFESISLRVNNVMAGWGIKVYSDTNCSNLVAQGTAGVSGYATLPISVSRQEPTTFRVQLLNPNRELSPCSTNSVTYTLDTIGPAVTSVSSSNTNGDHKTDDLIDISVTFAEPVRVTGTDLRLKLRFYNDEIGWANYVSGSETNTLIFQYKVTSNHTANDLDYFDSNSLELNTSTIRDDLGNEALLSLPAPGSPGSLAATKDLKVNYSIKLVDVIPPPARTYYSGDRIEFIAIWSGPVNISGTPTLSLYLVGSSTVPLTYEPAGSTNRETRFALTVGSSHVALGGVSISGISGGTINNFYGAGVDRTIPDNAKSHTNVRLNGAASAPSLSLPTAPLNFLESSAGGKITLSLAQPAPENLTLQLQAVPLGPIAAGDYTFEGTQTINQGATSVDLDLNIFNDPSVTGLKTFVLRALSLAKGTMAPGSNHQIIGLQDDEQIDTVRMVANGTNHVCVLYNSGTVRCYGQNNYGQLGTGNTETFSTPQQPVDLFNVDKIFAGGDSSCALLTDQTMKCWGRNQFGQLGQSCYTNPPSYQPTPKLVCAGATGTTPLSDILHVSFYGLGGCAIHRASNKNVLKCWGYNNNYQLGTGNTTNLAYPFTIPLGTGGDEPKTVDTSLSHSCAVSTNNKLYCWGSNASGATGRNTTSGTQARPAVVSTSIQFSELALDYRTSCGRTDAGAIHCWGEANDGQTGRGSSATSDLLTVPTTPINLGDGVTALTLTSSQHSTTTAATFCSLTSSNQILCWGVGHGEFADQRAFTESKFSPSPVKFTKFFSKSSTFSCGMDSASQSLSCINRPLGLRLLTRNEENYSPQSVLNVSPSKMALSNSLSCYALSDGKTRCVSSLPTPTQTPTPVGDGTPGRRDSPAEIIGSAAKGLAAGDWGGCHIDEGNVLRCWGAYYVGDGTTNRRTIPTFVMNRASKVMVSSNGTDHNACAIKLDGSLWCWGANNNGMFGLGAGISGITTPTLVFSGGVTDVSMGTNFMCAIVNGNIKCSGSNSTGQLGDASGADSSTPVDALNVWGGAAQHIASGASFSCAMFEDASLRCWGLGSSGQLGRGNTNNSTLPWKISGLSFKDFEIGQNHTCGLTTDNQFYCWGVNSSGQLGLGHNNSTLTTNYSPNLLPLTGVTKFWLGGTSTCALAGSPTQLYCWGANNGLFSARPLFNELVPMPGF